MTDTNHRRPLDLLCRTVITVAAFASAIWSADALVIAPMKQNLLVGSAIQANSAESSIPTVRRLVSELDGVDNWDPYLEGFGKTELGELKLRLGRREEAARDFAEALERRVRTELWVRAGLLELEIGNNAEAERYLRKAIRFFPDYRRRVPRGPLRERVDFRPE